MKIGNEIEALLEAGQIRLAVVVSDLPGASGRQALKQHLERIGVLERQQQELEQELTRQMKLVWEQVRRMPAGNMLQAVAHRLLRLIWRRLAQRVDYEERGPRQWDTARLAARTTWLGAEFRRHGHEVTFQPAQLESMT